MRWKVGLAGTVALVASTVLVGPAHAASPPPAQACTGQWRRVRSISPNHDNGDYNSLVSVSSVSSTDAWAVGITDDFDQPPSGFQTLAEHWDGSRWTPVPIPDSPLYSWNQLQGVSARASDDVWAAGSTAYVGNGLLVHWNGATWERTVLPQAIVFRAIAAVSPTDIWAVGQESTAQFLDLTVAMHWDGTSWTQVPTPSPLKLHSDDENWLTSLAAVSSNDVWAMGVARDPDFGIRDRPFSLHWDGARWTLFRTPDPGGATEDTDLEGAVAFASDDVWAVGSVGNDPDWSTFTAHWDGLAWTQVASSSPGRFLAVASDTTGGIWGVGDRSVSTPGFTATMVQHLC